MKKKIAAFLFSGAVAFGVFGAQGSTVQAAEEPCSCHPVMVDGTERNVAVAELISGDVFKATKADLFLKGYTWKGVAEVEVVKWTNGAVGISVPFINSDGIRMYSVFINGQYIGIFPR